MKNILLIIAGLMFLVNPLYAKGLEVQPPSYHWEVEAPGKKIEMPVPIKIINHSTRKRSYTLQARTPTEIGSWVAFETREVEVLPEAEGSVKVYINIPKESFGHSGMFYIEVKEKPPPGDRFALACYPKIYINAESLF